jgi:predicted small lipoprotein YifL
VEFRDFGRAMPSRLSRCAILAALVGTVHLAGCGQRGPLYLPDQAPAKKSLSLQAAPVGGAGLPLPPIPRS